jgi:hypothetical protein
VPAPSNYDHVGLAAGVDQRLPGMPANQPGNDVRWGSGAEGGSYGLIEDAPGTFFKALYSIMT